MYSEKMYNLMQCKSLWIKASAKCINVKCKCKLMDCTRFVSSYWELLPRSSSKALACSQTYLGGGAERHRVTCCLTNCHDDQRPVPL